MTSGRAVVLGDIGPWACAGMTGGRVYVRINAFGLDREAIERRLGEGAKVDLEELDAEGALDIEDLLGHYADELRATDQDGRPSGSSTLAADAREQLPDDRPREGPGGPEHLDRVAIDAPRERVFEVISDLSIRPSYTDHFMHSYRLERIEPRGVGAAARFRTGRRGARTYMDTAIEQVEPPHKISERGTFGHLNRNEVMTVWELEEGPGAVTTVRLTFWTKPANVIEGACASCSPSRAPGTGATGSGRCAASARSSRASGRRRGSRSPAVTGPSPAFPE